MLSFYDALILIGHPSQQSYADQLNQWLKRYGFQAWQLVTLPQNDTPNAIDAVVSHAHNVLIVATPTAYPNDVRAMIEQAVTYHKRLFLIHPLSPVAPLAEDEELAEVAPALPPWPDSASSVNLPDGVEDWADRESEQIQALQTLETLLEGNSYTATPPWLIEIGVQVEGDTTPLSVLHLIEALRDQEDIIHQHSRLLVNALHWASQAYAAEHLLTETDLPQATQWLSALAKQPRPTCQPTPLQRDLIVASTQRDDDAIVTVLLASADGDREMPLSPGGPPSVEALRELMQAEGFSLWDPHVDCPPEANLEIALSRATEACDNYVILLSPNALGHAACLQGLLFALSMNKRIVPVLLSTVDANHLPEPLQGMPWVDLRGVKAPLANTNAGRQLVQILRHEADYHRLHTQLLMAALRWERQHRHASGLLSPQEARTYQRWIEEAQQRHHHRPIALQELFVAASLQQGPSPEIHESPRQILAQLTDQMKTWLTQRIHR
ncbi:MAG: toll/interleukin-1 receptor domain-containing protein [Spirulina sp.]